MKRAMSIAAAAILCGCAAGPAVAPGPITLATGARGGGFFPYGEAMVKVLGEHTAVRLNNRETAGSNENLRLLEAGAVPVALGPAKGPAEDFFRGLIAELGIAVTMVNGAPADLASQLQAGAVDAFWYGAGVPIPAFKTLADAGAAEMRGLDEEALAAFLKRFPYLAGYNIAAGSYRGQAQPLASAAVWNFVLANPSLPESAAYALTRTLLEQTGALAAAYPAASATVAGNAPANGFLPFHPGALRYYRERGISLPPR